MARRQGNSGSVANRDSKRLMLNEGGLGTDGGGWMRDLIIVLGAEVPSGRAVAKKLRSEHYCCKLAASGVGVRELEALAPAGIIAAGELSEGAEPLSLDILTLGVPVLALGSSARALLAQMGERREGSALEKSVVPVRFVETPLFENVSACERWVESAEAFSLPEKYRVIADGDGMPLAFWDEAANVFLLQFQIERNDPDGMAMLLSFADTVCGCTPWWTVENIIADAEQALRKAVGDGVVICAMSGGLDSTVAAMLAKRALGDRVRCVFVDTGLLRQGEGEDAERYFRDELLLNFTRVDASANILPGLRGLTTTLDKWRVIEGEITREMLAVAEGTPGAAVYVKGTNYVDIVGRGDVEAGPFSPVVEPLRELFKDEIRMVGQALGLSQKLIGRQPFPGMGLAARIGGEVTAERLSILRRADRLFSDALIESGQDKRLSRYFAMLDVLNGHDTVVLRASQGTEPTMSVARLPHDLLERTIEQILKALPTVHRVLYDMTPGIAEWL